MGNICGIKKVKSTPPKPVVVPFVLPKDLDCGPEPVIVVPEGYDSSQ